MYLELIAIEALKGKHSNQPAKNFMTVLDYLTDKQQYGNKKSDGPCAMDNTSNQNTTSQIV